MDKVATKKLYELTDHTDFEVAKRTFLQTQDPHYREKDIKKKWSFIQTELSILQPGLQENLKRFIENRIQINNNLYKISLEDFLVYFEDFFFILANDRPPYGIGEAEKVQLFAEINTTLAAPEKSLATLFECILLRYKKCNNWVADALQKIRFQTILELRNKYISTAEIPETEKTAALKIMCKLAEKKGLGVRIHHYFQDFYTFPPDKDKITDYFLSHYPKAFVRNYEDRIEEHVTNILINDIASLINNAWNDLQPISQEVYEKIQALIRSRLNCELPECALEEGNYIIPKKENFAKQLKPLIETYLLKEGYFKNIEEVAEQNKEELVWLRRVKLGSILEIKQALAAFAPEKNQWMVQLLIKHSKTIIEYPSLLLNHIQSHPHLLFLFPKSLSNHSYFLKQLVKTLDKLILQALEKNDEALANQLIQHLTRLTRHQPDFLKNLSPALCGNDYFGQILFEKNPLNIKYLSLAVRQRISTQTNFTDPIAQFYAQPSIPQFNRLLDKYLQGINALHPTLKEKFPPNFKTALTSSERMDNFIYHYKKWEAVDRLLKTEKLSALTVSKLANYLDPTTFITILEIRAKEKLLPLPYCSVERIKNFARRVQDYPHIDWEKGYTTLKERACMLTRGNFESTEYSPLLYIARTNTWFTGMLQYERYTQGAFKSWLHWWNQVKKACQAFLGLAWSLAKIGVTAAVGIGMTLLASFLIGQFVPTALLFGLLTFAIAAPLLIQWLGNRLAMSITVTAALLASAIAAADVLIGLGTLIWVVQESMKLPRLLQQFANSLFDLVTRSFTALFSRSDLLKTPLDQPNLALRCEEIIFRLKLIEDNTAQEKAEILETLWHKIQQDIQNERPDNPLSDEQLQLALPNYLNKKYETIYQGNKYACSFNQIAAINRHLNGQSLLKQSPEPPRFFKKTTTTQLLTDRPQPANCPS